MTLPLWTSSDAIAATGGHSTGDWTAHGVSIDSRTLEPGDLFVAIKGPQHDGHDHVARALEAGAAAAMVERRPQGLPADAKLLVVPDSLAALERLGAAARQRSSAKVIAITGSVGKTSTKEALRSALENQGKTHASAASYNNNIGVPLTLARLPADAAYCISEIGMNHANEITPLVRQVRPHVVIITTVENVHIENFPGQGIEGVAAAKAEIFEGPCGWVAILNRDNPHFEFLSMRARARGFVRVVGFGAHPGADARLVDAQSGSTSSLVSALIDGRAVSYRLGAPGRHWVINSLAVLAAVAAVKADLGVAAAALASLSAPKGRGRRHKVGRAGYSFELIDDSYNASPASMRAAFEVLATAELSPRGKRIAVLGDMLELGPESPRMHAELADALVAARVDRVFTCGRNMARLYDALPQPLRGGHAGTSEQLAPMVKAAIQPGDVVMVKGSLGSRMQRIVDALLHGNDVVNGNGGRAAG
jgi:UDP-N-acetylmuramoyl-tripeptide--D-alanyl-D-alanine ligase